MIKILLGLVLLAALTEATGDCVGEFSSCESDTCTELFIVYYPAVDNGQPCEFYSGYTRTCADASKCSDNCSTEDNETTDDTEEKTQWPKHSPVVTLGHDALAMPAVTVTAVDLADPHQPIVRLAERMIRALHVTAGAAIAANQLGVRKRLVVISIPPERIRQENTTMPGATRVMPPVALVNPELWPVDPQGMKLEDLNSTRTTTTTLAWESCLSVPQKYVLVQRWRQVGWRAQRLDGVWCEGVVRGRLALLLQHEVDHLNGVCMTDHVNHHDEIDGAIQDELRTDGLGPISSTEHWDLMTAPEYSLLTSALPGASEVL